MAVQKKEKGKAAVTKEPLLKRYQWQLLLAVLTFILYANSVPNDYNLDDELVTRKHRFTSRGLEAIPDILTNPYYADAMGYKYEYRPIVHVTFAIEHQFFGESATTSHFFNLLLYAMLCIVLYNLLKQLFLERYPWLPVIASIIFVVHPIHTEVVCSIKNRDEILSLLFMLLAWKHALNFFYNDKKAGIFSILFVVLSLLSKNTSFSLLLLIPLSTLLLSRKNNLYGIPLFTLAVLPVSYFSIPALQSRFYLIALALIGVSMFTMIVQNLDAVKQQIASFGRELRSMVKGGVASLNIVSGEVLNPFWPKDTNGIILLVLATLYFIGCAFSKSPYVFIFNGILLIAAMVRFRQNILRILPILVSIFLFYFLTTHHHEEIVIEFLYMGLSLYVITAVIAKDRIAIAAGVALLAVLQIKQIEFPRLVLFIILPLLYLRTGKAIWVYLMTGITSLLAIILGIVVLSQNENSVLDYSRYIVPILFSTYYGFVLLKKQGQVLEILVKLQIFIVSVVFVFSAFYFIYRPDMPVVITTALVEQLRREQGIEPEEGAKISTERNLEFPELPIGLNPSPSIRFGTAATIFAQYLKLITIAYPLSYYYGYAIVKPMPLISIPALTGGALGAVLVLLAIVLYKRNIAISVGIAFFLITIFPFLNIIIPLPGMMADRFLLIPSIGFCIAVAGALHYFIKQGISQFGGVGSIRLLPLVPKVALTLVALVYSGFTIARNAQWENHLVLFEHDINHLDESTQAHNLLALQYIIYSFDQKDPATQQQYRLNAEKHLKRAIEIYPQFFNPHYDLGRLNEMMNRPDSALLYYSRTVTIDSTFPTPYLNASRIMQGRNDLRGSVGWLEHGLRFDTLDMEWYNLLSFDLYRLNDFKGSIEINKLAMRRISRTPDLLAHIGQAYLSALELDSARVYLEQANAQNPNIQGLQGALQQLNKLQPQTNTAAAQGIQP